MAIGGAEVSAAARAVGVARRLLRRPDPAAVLKRREKVKKELRRKAFKKKYIDQYEDRTFHAIRLGKLKSYPDTDTRRLPFGEPDWREIHIWRLDRRGLEIDLGYRRFVVKRGRARQRPPRGREENFVSLRKVGIIPYECIEHIEWSPTYEPYYTRPRLHVRYSWRRKSPFQKIVLYELSGYRGLYNELTGIKYCGYPLREKVKQFINQAKKNAKGRRLNRTSRKVTEEFLG
jgi:hypothetical protein